MVHLKMNLLEEEIPIKKPIIFQVPAVSFRWGVISFLFYFSKQTIASKKVDHLFGRSWSSLSSNHPESASGGPVFLFE